MSRSSWNEIGAFHILTTDRNGFLSWSFSKIIQLQPAHPVTWFFARAHFPWCSSKQAPITKLAVIESPWKERSGLTKPQTMPLVLVPIKVFHNIWKWCMFWVMKWNEWLEEIHFLIGILLYLDVYVFLGWVQVFGLFWQCLRCCPWMWRHVESLIQGCRYRIVWILWVAVKEQPILKNFR